MLKEGWTPQAIEGYERIISFILQKWTSKEASGFIDSVQAAVLLIRKFPFIHPVSQMGKGIRRCVVHKRTSLYYRVKSDSIEIVDVIDNRTNPSKIKNQLKKS